MDLTSSLYGAGAYIRVDGGSTTTARIPFAAGIQLNNTSTVLWGNDGTSSGSFIGPVYAGIPGFQFKGGQYATGAGINTLLLGGDATAPDVDGGVFILLGGSIVSNALYGYCSVGYLGSPNKIVRTSVDAISSLYIYKDLEVDGTAYFDSTVNLSSLTASRFLKLDGSKNIVSSTAATIDISSETNLAVTSPITLTGDTVGFSFATNNTWTGTQTYTGATNTWGSGSTVYTFTSIVSGSWPTHTLFGQVLVPAITTTGPVKRSVPMIFGSEDVTVNITNFRYQLAGREFVFTDRFSWYLGQDGTFVTRGAIVISAVPKTGTAVSTSDFELVNAFQLFSTGGAVASSMFGVRADVAGASVQINYNNPAGTDPTWYPLLCGPYQTGVDFAIYQGGALFWGDHAVTGAAPLNVTGQSYSKYPVTTVTDANTQIPFDCKLYRASAGVLQTVGSLYVGGTLRIPDSATGSGPYLNIGDNSESAGYVSIQNDQGGTGHLLFQPQAGFSGGFYVDDMETYLERGVTCCMDSSFVNMLLVGAALVAPQATPSASIHGIFSRKGNLGTGGLIAGVFEAEFSSSSNSSSQTQGLNVFSHTATGTVGNLTQATSAGGLRGGRSVIRQRGSGTIARACAQSYQWTQDASTGAVTDSIGLLLEAPVIGTSSTTTNWYGIKFEAAAVYSGTLTNTYYIYCDELLAGTNRYEIWMAGGAKIQFREAAEKIYSSASKTLDYDADTSGGHQFRIAGTVHTTIRADTVTLNGNSAKSITGTRSTSGAGAALTITSGSAQSGATDTAAGNLNLSTGTSTGSSSTVALNLMWPIPGLSGTTDRSPATQIACTATSSQRTMTLISTGNQNWQIIGGRHDTSSGNSLTVQAPGAQSGGTNLNGGSLVLSSGISTGNGGSSIIFRAVASNQGSGTTDRTPTTAWLTIDTTRLLIADAINLDVGTTTGTKIGVSTSQKLGFWNATPVVQPSAYTQTYSTATKTHSNPTATTISTTAATNTTPWGYTTQAQADAIVAAINALIVDVANAKQVINAIIDDDQSIGIKA